MQAGYTDLKDIAHQCICKQNYFDVEFRLSFEPTIFRTQQSQKLLIKTHVEFYSQF